MPEVNIDGKFYTMEEIVAQRIKHLEAKLDKECERADAAETKLGLVTEVASRCHNGKNKDCKPELNEIAEILKDTRKPIGIFHQLCCDECGEIDTNLDDNCSECGGEISFHDVIVMDSEVKIVKD